MRYMVIKSIIKLRGRLWIGGEGFYEMLVPQSLAKDLTSRELVSQYIAKNCGDFQEIIDFDAEMEIGEDTVTFGWEKEDSEHLYYCCMSEEE